MSDESLPEQLRALARGIEAGDAVDVEIEEELDLRIGEDRLAVSLEWVR